MAAKKKAAKKKAAPKRAPMKGDRGVGHNSDDQAQKDEMLKVAKAQAKLEDQKAEIRAEEKKLKKRLADVGVTLQHFKPAFAHYMEIRDAKDDAEVKRIQDDYALFMDSQRRCFEALSPGAQADWITMIQDAPDIRAQRELEEREAREAEEAAAAEAAEAGDEGTVTESVH